jgi:HK97 family phage major capsid protein
MARNTMEAWIPEEFDSQVITRVNQMSAAEALFRKVPMNTATKSVPRSAGMGVAVVPKGGAYSEDQSANDQVVLSAYKFGSADRIAEEDIDDSLADVVATKQKDWATSYAKALDNACLAVTAAQNGTTVPFVSVYKALRTTDATVGYTADANYVPTAGTGAAATYSQLSKVVGAIETGDYFDEANLAVIAHPSFKASFRGILDSQNRPIFIQGTASTPDSLFGYPVKWSLGAKTSATNTSAPTGNPLLFVVNTQLMLLGTRSGPESVFIDGRSGLAALTDESILKMRARRAFAVGHPGAAAVLEVLP